MVFQKKVRKNGIFRFLFRTQKVSCTKWKHFTQGEGRSDPLPHLIPWATWPSRTAVGVEFDVFKLRDEQLVVFHGGVALVLLGPPHFKHCVWAKGQGEPQGDRSASPLGPPSTLSKALFMIRVPFSKSALALLWAKECSKSTGACHWGGHSYLCHFNLHRKGRRWCHQST